MKNKSKIIKVIIWVAAIVFIVLVAVALRFVFAYNGFLDKITERKPETKEYNVVVKNDSELKELAELENKSISFLKIDTKAVRAEQSLQGEVKFQSDYYEDINIMMETLENRITDAVVLETDRIEILKEEVEGTADKIRIIYTFSIEIEGEDEVGSTKEVSTEPFIAYISGSDSRNGIKATARSDVNIIAVVNPKQGKILLVSIPRDAYVQLHGTTGLKDKLTHAGVYGIEMSKTTIEDFLGINIDYTIKVSFATVIRVVDQLDGIDIESDTAMKLKAEDGKICEYVVGKQHVNGDCALRFARERKSYKTGDRHRGENQQQVITSIIGKLSGSKSYLLKLPTILDIAADSFETTFSRDNISAFIRMQLINAIDWKVESISVDGTGTYQPTYSMGANRPLYVLIPNAASVDMAAQKIREYLTVEVEEIEEELSGD